MQTQTQVRDEGPSPSAIGRWQLLDTKNEGPKKYGQIALFRPPHYVVVFGGSTEQASFSNQLHVLNLETRCWTELSAAGSCGERHFHSGAEHQNGWYVFGGKSNGYHNDLQRLEPLSPATLSGGAPLAWQTVTARGRGPAARFGHSCVECDGQLLLFGGYDHHGWCTDDLLRCALPPQTPAWTRLWPPQQPSPAPSPARSPPQSRGDAEGRVVDSPGAGLERYHHTAVVHQRRMVVFGGRGPAGARGDLLEWTVDGGTWTRLGAAGHAPSPRYGHAACLVSSLMFVFGGTDGHGGGLADLYRLDLDARVLVWQLVDLPTCPAPRFFHALLPLPGPSLLLLGGKTAHGRCPPDLHQFVLLESLTHASPHASPAASLASSAGPSASSGPASGTRIRLKCHFEREIRLVPVERDLSYAALVAFLAAQYALPTGSQLRIQYADAEGDMITVRSQTDWEEALVVASAAPVTAPFKLFLAPAPASPAPSLSSAPSTSAAVAAAPLKPAVPVVSASAAASKRQVVWKKGPLLGSGAFGQVFLAIDSQTGQMLAVKVLPIVNSASPALSSAIDVLQTEIDVMSSLQHPNIVRYLGCQRADGALHIFLEYVAGGSLAGLLSKFHQLPEPLIANFTKQILVGLSYLHKKGIAHRDIKGANILIDNQGVIKLADFGASKQLHSITTLNDGCATVTGTPYYMAPEVIQGNKHYGRKADLWSVGAVVVEMATGHPPFHDLAPVPALFRIGSPGTIPDIPKHLSAVAQAFLGLCFQRDPKIRPSTDQLLEHEFLAGSRVAPVPPIQPSEQLTFRASVDEAPRPAVGYAALASSQTEETEILSYLREAGSILTTNLDFRVGK